MSIAEKLQRILTAKNAIKQALIGKGANIDDTTPFEEYDTAIENIPTGGGGDNQVVIDLIEGDITSIEIPYGATCIGRNAFYDNENLVDVLIPSSVTEIKEGAFMECSKLAEISIPDSVTIIQQQAFYYCSSLQKVIIGNGIQTITVPAYNIFNVFGNCSKLLEIHIDLPHDQTRFTVPTNHWGATNSTIYWNDGWITEPNATEPVNPNPEEPEEPEEPVLRDLEITDTSIPANNVTSIGSKAFQNCTNMTEIHLGSNITCANISSDAFTGCTNLKSIYVDLPSYDSNFSDVRYDKWGAGSSCKVYYNDGQTA